MDSLITPTKKEINGIESCQSFQFVCKGDGCRVKEINQKWFSFSFSHVPTEFKIKLSFLVYFLCSLLGQCRNEENWFSVFSFVYFFGINWRNKHIYKGQLELPMEQRLRNKTFCFGKSSVFQKHYQQYSKISFCYYCTIKNFMM